jgi:tetratricopeptide (TPR) repeat protein
MDVKINMVEERFLEIKRNEIRDARIKEEDFAKAIKKCFEFLKVINSLKETNTTNDKWFIHHNIALNSKKLNNFKTAIKHEFIALDYADSSTKDVDYKFIYSTWLLGLCFKENGDFKKAIRLFDECSKRYKKIKDEQQRICTLHEKAKLYKDTKAMEKFIKFYESKTLNITIQTHGDLEYDEVLTEMYTDLFELYRVQDVQKAYQLLYKVKDENLRKGLMVKLKVA